MSVIFSDAFLKASCENGFICCIWFIQLLAAIWFIHAVHGLFAVFIGFCQLEKGLALVKLANGLALASKLNFFAESWPISHACLAQLACMSNQFCRCSCADAVASCALLSALLAFCSALFANLPK